MPAVRIITASDIPSAMRLKDVAGWNQTQADWRNLLSLAPDGCFGIECDGALVATTTAVCFGRELAWIGMVLTHPDYRGRGLARSLMEHALAYLKGRVDWVKLDATDMGRPLYRSLGFEDECAIERWVRAAGAAPRQEVPPAQDYAGFDRTAFGADRSELLALLASVESAAVPDGYAMGRPGSKAAYFGPCVAQTRAAAELLVGWFVGRHALEAIYWDILPGNREVIRLARKADFQPLRKLTRMATGGTQPLPHDDQMVYAIAGFEFG